MNVGDRIKTKRKELGLSVDDLAEALNKDRSTIYRYESNEIEKMPTTILEPLSKVLRTTPAYLMGWDEQKSQSEIITEDEKLLLSKYSRLNKSGKTKTHDYIDDLLDNDKYIAPIKQTIAAHGADETEGTNQPPIQETIL